MEPSVPVPPEVAPPATKRGEARANTASAAADPTVGILLVDDEPRNLDVLETILNAPDYRLVRAQTADAALMALVREDFACVVLDIRIPGMSGIELARLIKSRRRRRTVTH